MYYPYLRGKQFDLLALKELVKAERLKKTIVPVIEPVKQSKTLLQTLEVFRQKGQPFYLIDNPQAGDFLTETGLETLQELAQGHRAHIITANQGELHFPLKTCTLLTLLKDCKFYRKRTEMANSLPLLKCGFYAS
ncbi:sce7725 family protein [Enterococcus asini]|uniref:sce7725 family protein n=1 Tax=Enterococcus asini TaxID=57732 RepID=UPI000E492F91|nr:sce7725 family protein [Enterococcus asini]RGW12894.1 hypothetical protein DWV91_07265 [Enterococcus asini]